MDILSILRTKIIKSIKDKIESFEPFNTEFLVFDISMV